jgi:hypothetical protein
MQEISANGRRFFDKIKLFVKMNSRKQYSIRTIFQYVLTVTFAEPPRQFFAKKTPE